MTNVAEQTEKLIEFTTNIVSAHVASNNVAVSDIPKLIENVHSALHGLSDQKQSQPQQDPAVPIKLSVKSDHLICLGCGAKMKMLKRHIMTHHQMTPDEYRQYWNLPANYPMVSSEYSKIRSGLAKQIGLGRQSD